MINICGNRGSGKTIKLVEMANAAFNKGENVAIVTVTGALQEIYTDHGLNPRIPVINYKMYQKEPEKYAKYKLYVDEVQAVLQKLFIGAKIEAMTTDLEDLVVLNRKIWDEDYI